MTKQIYTKYRMALITLNLVINTNIIIYIAFYLIAHIYSLDLIILITIVVILFTGSFFYFFKMSMATNEILKNKIYMYYENSNSILVDNYLIIKNDFIREEIDLDTASNFKVEENIIFFESKNSLYKFDLTPKLLNDLITKGFYKINIYHFSK